MSLCCCCCCCCCCYYNIYIYTVCIYIYIINVIIVINAPHGYTSSLFGRLVKRVESYDLEGLILPFTLNELCLIKLGTFNRELHATLEEATNHVLGCKVRTLQTIY